MSIRPLLLLALCALAAPLAAQSEEEVKQANNPLATITSVNIQNYYVSTLYAVPNAQAGTLYLRVAKPLGKFLVRASLPMPTVPTGGDPESGIGDFNIFGTYIFKKTDRVEMGLGPQLVAPTAGNDALGAGKWQGGLAFVTFYSLTPQVQLGGLITWQASFAGDEARAETNLLAVQPFVLMQVGGGWYLRSTGIMPFDLENNTFAVPIGMGAGKVVKAGNTVFNLFVEPQFTVLHDGAGQAAFQTFMGVNMQFIPKH